METIDNTNENQGITENIRQSFRSTAPWIKFIAITAFALQGIGLLQNMMLNPRGLASSIFGVAISVALNVILFQYGKSLENTANTGANSDLRDAMNKQRAYWIFLGILMILVCLAFLILGIMFAAEGNSVMRQLRLF